ncbi:MAG TPA: CHAT domain-containing protein [Planctomycetota bacterium]|nr:CHAT domain-containing protein [Planctomycetota bacterium]
MKDRRRTTPGVIARRVLRQPGYRVQLAVLRSMRHRFGPELAAAFVAEADAVVRARPADAVQRARLAVVVARGAGDTRGEADAHRALADACVVSSRFARGLRALENAVRAARGVDAAWAVRLDAQRIHPLVHLERYEEARAAGEAVLPHFEAQADRRSQIRTRMALADLEYRLDRPREALRHYARVDALLAPDAPARLRAVLAANRANALEAVHRFRAAERAFEAARRLFRAAGCEHSAAQVDYNESYFQLLRGRYDAALRGYARTGEVFARLSDDRHLALIDLERAEIHLRLHMPAEAAALARAAAERFERIGLAKERAQAEQLLGAAAETLGRNDEALTHLGAAQEAFAALGLEARSTGCVVQRAGILLGMGRAAEARALAGEASGAPGATLPLARASVELLLARLAAREGGLDEALARTGRVLDECRTLFAPWLRVEALRLAAKIRLSRGQTREAIALYREAVERLEEDRAGVPPDEYMASFLAGHAGIYGEVVELLARGGEVGEAFEYSERAKARALLDLLGRRNGDRRGGRPFGELRIRHLRERLDALYHRMFRGDDQRSGRALRETQREAEALERRLAGLLRESRAPRGPRPGAAPGLGAVQAALEEGTALIEYLVTGRTIVGFAVTRDAVRAVVQEAPADGVEVLVQRFLFHMARFEAPQPPEDSFAVDAARASLARLSDLLLAPLLDGLDADRLVVVPHGPLHRVPFHALPWGDGWVADRFDVVYAPSAAVHQLPRRRAPARGRAAVFGLADRAAPEIDREARAVAAMLGTDRVHLGAGATLARLREAADAPILHIATHGMFRWGQPTLSSLRLADTWLNLYDLYDLELRADLVVLSACEGGAADVSRGGELMGLLRGFLCAGARAIVASQWRVNDAATAEFMQAFYRNLRDGRGASGALREAMAEIRSLRPHPYFWAPFFLVGRPIVPAACGREEPQVESVA